MRNFTNLSQQEKEVYAEIIILLFLDVNEKEDEFLKSNLFAISKQQQKTKHQTTEPTKKETL